MWLYQEIQLSDICGFWWSKDPRSGKWIPLDFNSDRRHECRKHVYRCKKRVRRMDLFWS